MDARITGEIVAPTIRTRILMNRTQRDGWRCSETTVEVEMNEAQAVAGERMQNLLDFYLRDAHEAGLLEAQRRNTREGIGGGDD